MSESKIYIKSIRISRVIVISILLIIQFFFFAGLLVTSFERTKFESINNWALKISNQFLLNAYRSENIHYQFVPESKESNVMSELLTIFTAVKLSDLRSFISQEIPGFRQYYNSLLVAGEGTDFTNIPNESNIPTELLKTDYDAKENVKEQIKENTNATVQGNLQPEVLLYYSHTRESFLPLLNGTSNPDQALSTKANVTILGDWLKGNLEKQGIGVVNNETDITKLILDRKLNYRSSYQVSREVVKKELNQHQSLEYLIDIHRDSSGKEITTKEINGKNYARLYFVVGIGNPNFEKNMELVKFIDDYLNKHYYGISRGIFPKGFNQGNGIYNQDLSPNALLVEIGGVDNNLEELKNTVDVFTEAFLAFYKTKKAN